MERRVTEDYESKRESSNVTDRVDDRTIEHRILSAGAKGSHFNPRWVPFVAKLGFPD